MNFLALSTLWYVITLMFHSSEFLRDKMNRILLNILKSVAYKISFTYSSNLYKNLNFPTFNHLFVDTVVVPNFRESRFFEPKNIPPTLRRIARFETYPVRPRCGKYIRTYYVPLAFNTFSDDVFQCAAKFQLKRMLINAT